jgi:hypothetical protein
MCCQGLLVLLQLLLAQQQQLLAPLQQLVQGHLTAPLQLRCCCRQLGCS